MKNYFFAFWLVLENIFLYAFPKSREARGNVNKLTSYTLSKNCILARQYFKLIKREWSIFYDKIIMFAYILNISAGAEQNIVLNVNIYES